MPKISALPAAVAVAAADLAPIVQGGTTKKATYSLVLAYVQANIQITEAQVTNLTTDLAAKLAKASNLSDLADIPTARSNLGLGAAALISTPIAVTNGGTGLSSTTVNQILYSSAANTIAGLATANSSVLITSGAGVPSLSTAIPSGVTCSTPSAGTELANKNYVDQTALNGTSVYAATAAGLTVTQAGAGPGATLTNAGAMAAFSIDGVSPPAGVNVLVKDIAAGGTAANYGIYTVTDVGSGASNWVLTRATSFDTATEINNTGLIVINNGSTLAGKAWYNTATIVTVDTTNFVFVQFASQTLTVAQQIFTASGTYTPTAGMTYCIIEAVGGGGGSAGTSSASGANSAAGGGGGAAGYSKGVYTLAQIKGAGTVAAITVGTGGAGGAAGNNSGSPGNATTVIANNGAGATLMTCNGGNGGSFMASTSGSDRTNGGTGGTASGGSLNVAGNAGWPGLVISGVSIPAYGGASYYGGVSRPVFNSAGVAATGYGSGGTGGWDQGVGTDLAGAAGSDGVVYITEYIAT